MVAGYSDPTIRFEKKLQSINGKKLEPYELVKHSSSGSSETSRSQLKNQQLHDHSVSTDSAYNVSQTGKIAKRRLTLEQQKSILQAQQSVHNRKQEMAK